MIHISIVSDSKGFIKEFSVDGHAGYDEAGKDIVCAAVSAVIQTAVLGLTDVIGLKPVYRQENGHLRCVLPSDISSDDRIITSAVLHTMLAGLKSIKYGYKDFISIIEREVR